MRTVPRWLDRADPLGVEFVTDYDEASTGFMSRSRKNSFCPPAWKLLRLVAVGTALNVPLRIVVFWEAAQSRGEDAMVIRTSTEGRALRCGGTSLRLAGRPACRNRTLVALGVVVCLFGGADEGVADRKGQGKTYCRMGYDIRTIEATVSDHTSSDNTPVGDVTIRKNCSGSVIGTFTAALTANLHLHELWAYCVSNGGFVDGCTPGQNIYAFPPHTLLQSNGVPDISYPVETVRWIWPQVPPGEWRFRVLPAALSSVTIKYSSFTVEAFQKP